MEIIFHLLFINKIRIKMLKAAQVETLNKGLQHFPSSEVFQPVTDPAKQSIVISQGFGPGAKLGATRTAPTANNKNSAPNQP